MELSLWHSGRYDQCSFCHRQRRCPQTGQYSSSNCIPICTHPGRDWIASRGGELPHRVWFCCRGRSDRQSTDTLCSLHRLTRRWTAYLRTRIKTSEGTTLVETLNPGDGRKRCSRGRRNC